MTYLNQHDNKKQIVKAVYQAKPGNRQRPNGMVARENAVLCLGVAGTHSCSTWVLEVVTGGVQVCILYKRSTPAWPIC
jgi:hypothetical protein